VFFLLETKILFLKFDVLIPLSWKTFQTSIFSNIEIYFETIDKLNNSLAQLIRFNECLIKLNETYVMSQ
jgi:hypothetical protein